MNRNHARLSLCSAWVFALSLTVAAVGWGQSTPQAEDAQGEAAPAASSRAAPSAPSAPRVARVPSPPRPPRAPRAPRLSGGYLGVELVDLTPDLREHFGAPREVGVMVGRVAPGSPAARAGLEVADIVVRVGEEPVHDSWGFSGEISTREGGESIALAVVRDRRERRIDATLEHRDREAVDVGRWIFPRKPFPPGFPPTAPDAPALPEIGPALERLGRLLESSELQDQLRAAQMTIDTEVKQRMKELETRLKELEKRLQDGER